MAVLPDFPIVNRSLITVEKKKPYLDWANSLPDRCEEEIGSPFSMNELNDEPSSYLIPEIFDEDELDLYLDRIWVLLFESLLAQWSTDESLWPKKRSKNMFSEWFDITLHSLVHDLWSKEKLGYSDY